jgi:hypothetical protein
MEETWDAPQSRVGGVLHSALQLPELSTPGNRFIVTAFE